MTKIAVFASGEGTNLQALIEAAKSRRVRGEVVLVVSNKDDAGALRRAERAGIERVVVKPKDFADLDEYSAALAAECKKRGVELICLAGWLLHLKSPLLSAYPGRILNIHPSLLPSFGGKGLYGSRVHEEALACGAKVSGCTVHFVDEDYDRGPIVSQTPVPVLAEDTCATLAARVRAQEHWAYPEAVRLFCEGRLRLEGRHVRVLPSHRDASPRVKRALVSVSDKTGLAEFCRGLHELGVELVSTSGTAKALREAGLEVRSLDTVTGYPEILQGRVKTLHPKIHGGILLRRRDPEQAREAESLGLEPIDMVVVNLYPFAAAAARASSPYSREVIEQIDIGGVALIRAAAKNFEDVAVVVAPADYAAVLKELEAGQGQLALETRRRLALGAFRPRTCATARTRTSAPRSTRGEAARASSRSTARSSRTTTCSTPPARGRRPASSPPPRSPSSSTSHRAAWRPARRSSRPSRRRGRATPSPPSAGCSRSTGPSPARWPRRSPTASSR